MSVALSGGRLMTKMAIRTIAAATLVMSVACAAGGSSGGAAPSECAPEKTRACSCADGQSGTQKCAGHGEWEEACACPPRPPPPDTPAPACTPACNDQALNPRSGLPRAKGLDVTLHEVSPSQRGARLRPRPVEEEPMRVMNSPACRPRLRLRVASVTVHQDREDSGDEIYCVVSAEGRDAEVRVTRITPQLADGKGYEFTLSEGIFWGQSTLKETGTNLHLKYECIENDEPGAWSKLIQDLGAELARKGADAAGAAAGAWVVPIAEGVTGLIGNLLGVGRKGEERLFEATQTIDYDKQLELAAGAYWTVRRSGKDFDWELRVEAWGCAAGASAH
jgi:hypothetical protein